MITIIRKTESKLINNCLMHSVTTSILIKPTYTNEKALLAYVNKSIKAYNKETQTNVATYKVDA